MLDDEIFGSKGEVGDVTELGSLLGFNFETDEIEVEVEDFFNFDDVFGADEFVVVVNYHAEVGVFADGFNIEDVVGSVDDGAVEFKGEDFKIIGIDDGTGDLSDGTAGLDAEDWGADKLRVID